MCYLFFKCKGVILTKAKKNLILLFTVFGALIWIFAIGSYFVVDIRNNEIKQVQLELSAAGNNNARAVEQIFDKYINFLLLIAHNLEVVPYSPDEYESLIRFLSDIEDFTTIAAVYPTGESYLVQEGKLLITDYTFNANMLSGEVFISDVYYDPIAENNAVSVNVPVHNPQGEVVIYLVGVLDTRVLSQYFSQTFYEVGGYFHVVDSNGRYVAVSESDMMIGMDILFLDALYDLEYLQGYTPEEIVNSFQNRTIGFTQYTSEGNDRMAYYSPININNWLMYSVIVEENVDAKVNDNLSTSFLLVGNIIIVFLVLLAVIYNSQNELQQLAVENDENFRFLAEKTNKFIIHWDFESGDVKLSGGDDAMLDRSSSASSMTNDIYNGLIHPDNINDIVTAINSLQTGEEFTDLKIRIRHKSGQYIRCAVSGFPLVKDRKKSFFVPKAIGFIEDIEESEQEKEALREMSELDSLTGVYNKGTTENLIQKTIAQSSNADSMHALLIIDLDNFKSINDTFGHQFGDDVIKSSADYLKSAFRRDDVVGRVGGDEFFVLMKNITNKQLIIDKSRAICAYANKSITSNGKTVDISSSIGIAIFSEHGKTFEELYKNADIALYHAKKEGKNNFQFYNGQTEVNYVSQRTNIDN